MDKSDKERKVLSYLGLAKKAGRIASGEYQTEEAVKKGKTCLVLLACDASQNTKKKFENTCRFHRIRVRCFSDKESLGAAIGCGPRSSLALLDTNLAAAILGILGQDERTG